MDERRSCSSRASSLGAGRMMLQLQGAATTPHLADNKQPLPPSTKSAKTLSDPAATSYGPEGQRCREDEMVVCSDILTTWLPNPQRSSSSISVACLSTGTLVTCTASCSATNRAWRTSSPPSVPASGTAAMILERTSGTHVTSSPASILSIGT